MEKSQIADLIARLVLALDGVIKYAPMLQEPKC